MAQRIVFIVIANICNREYCEYICNYGEKVSGIFAALDGNRQQWCANSNPDSDSDSNSDSKLFGLKHQNPNSDSRYLICTWLVNTEKNVILNFVQYRPPPHLYIEVAEFLQLERPCVKGLNVKVDLFDLRVYCKLVCFYDQVALYSHVPSAQEAFDLASLKPDTLLWNIYCIRD